jgi:hypothetical protein
MDILRTRLLPQCSTTCNTLNDHNNRRAVHENVIERKDPGSTGKWWEHVFYAPAVAHGRCSAIRYCCLVVGEISEGLENISELGGINALEQQAGHLRPFTPRAQSSTVARIARFRGAMRDDVASHPSRPQHRLDRYP